jgi:hypothetical protein
MVDKFSEVPNSELRAMIDEWIHSSRERDMLKDHLIDGMTYEKMAEKYDISVRWMKHLMCRNMHKLISHK